MEEFPPFKDNKLMTLVDEDGEGIIEGGHHEHFGVPTDLNDGVCLCLIGDELVEDEGLASGCIH